MSLFDSQAIVYLGNLRRLCMPALGTGQLQPCHNIADLRQPNHRAITALHPRDRKEPNTARHEQHQPVSDDE